MSNKAPRNDSIDYIEEYTKLNNLLINLQRELTLKNKRTEQLSRELTKINAELDQRVEDRTKELKETQEKLRRSENLAMVGKLAGFVGHELRNTLTSIMTTTSILKKIIDENDERGNKVIGILENSVEKTKRIIIELLDFAKIKEIKKENVHIHELIDYALVSRRSNEKVIIELKLTSEDDSIKADTIQLDRALKNLVNNAMEAMQSGGTLHIATSRSKKDFVIIIKDTGIGIPNEDISKVFTPLFTSKKEGVGLGLVFVKEMIEAHGGTIEFSSEVNIGTTFTIHLPLS